MRQLKNEWLLGFATSTKERISVLPQQESPDNNLSSLTQWRLRKTLITDSDFDTMLKYQNLSDNDFNLGVTPLTEFSLKKLFTFVQNQEWYKLHKKLFSMMVEFNPIGLEAALRFHADYYLLHINSYLLQCDNMNLSSSCIVSLKEHLVSELLLIAQRTLVWDVHDAKNRMSIKEADPEREFSQYLQFRFGSAYDTELFFLEYPTLARLLAERLSYAIKNFRHIIHAIAESSDRLTNIFDISKPFIINKWASQNGDSHNKGKTTTLLEINNIPLAFKYHNNDALISFNQFLSYLEKKEPQYSFYKISCVSGKAYCFEEFIKNESCTDISEIKQYYKNYGYLVAITYWLGSIDLHMENLIAKGMQPVLIDVETLMRSEERRYYTREYTKNKFFETDSVVTSGLLPMNKYWKRQIDFSALNGVKQRLPFKVRKLIYEDTSNIIYKLEEAYLSTSQNVPLLNDLPIPFKDYEPCIIDGYQKMISFLQQNKDELLCMLNILFNKIQLRVLLRDTQDYQNFLDFSTHPSCMVDYIEREKIFENLWNNTFIHQGVILHEINALLEHDTPYFYTYTNSLNIYTTESSIKKFFTKNMLTSLKKHVNEMNRETSRFSLLMIKESLNTLSADYEIISISQNNVHISNIYLQKAADIADLIIENVILDENENVVLWAETIKYNDKTFSLDYPNQNLYNGTSGLFIFFYFMDQFAQSSKYRKILYILEREVFNQSCTDSHYSAFYGIGARLTAAFVAYRYKKENKYLDYLIDNLKLILNNISNYTSWDWIFGKSSLVCILSRIYQEYSIPLAKVILEKFTEDISIEKNLEAGFAHGYAGIMYSLLCSNSILLDKHIEEKIKALYKLLLESLHANPNISSSWCRGTAGINKSLSEFYLYFPTYTKEEITPLVDSALRDSCLCHGSYGKISHIIEQYLIGKLPQRTFESSITQIIGDSITLQCNSLLKPIGIFAGLSGLGYQLLRILEPSLILDILYL